MGREVLSGRVYLHRDELGSAATSLASATTDDVAKKEAALKFLGTTSFGLRNDHGCHDNGGKNKATQQKILHDL